MKTDAVYNIVLIQRYLRRLVDSTPWDISVSNQQFILFENSFKHTGLRVSNANQSPVPIGNKPIELHLYSPSASVSMFARI